MKEKLIDATVQVVSGYLSRNTISAYELPDLIRHVAKSIARISEDEFGDVAATTTDFVKSEETATVSAYPAYMMRKVGVRSVDKPAVAIKDSVTDDYIVCLEDGKRLKMLKRHIKAMYNMTPEDYRRKWNLPKDYPMVCRNYANLRSHLAKEGGLGVGIQPKVAVG